MRLAGELDKLPLDEYLELIFNLVDDPKVIAMIEATTIENIIGRIRDLDNDIQVALVARNPQSIMSIENPCEAAELEFIKGDPGGFSFYIENPSIKLQLAHVRGSSYFLHSEWPWDIVTPSVKVIAAMLKKEPYLARCSKKWPKNVQKHFRIKLETNQRLRSLWVLKDAIHPIQKKTKKE
jgi:hypothetical protein